MKLRTVAVKLNYFKGESFLAGKIILPVLECPQNPRLAGWWSAVFYNMSLLSEKVE